MTLVAIRLTDSPYFLSLSINLYISGEGHNQCKIINVKVCAFLVLALDL